MKSHIELHSRAAPLTQWQSRTAAAGSEPRTRRRVPAATGGGPGRRELCPRLPPSRLGPARGSHGRHCLNLRGLGKSHLQTKSFQYCVQKCAIYAYIYAYTITQYIQYVQYVQYLYTILKILFAHHIAQQYCTSYCTAVLRIILHTFNFIAQVLI